MTPKERKRFKAAKQKEAADRKRLREIEAMKNSTVHGIQVKVEKFKPLGEVLTPTVVEVRNTHLNIVKEERVVSYDKRLPRYEGELAERENIAQEEIERKKTMVAPAYNKGAYQFITPETNLKEIGRKL